METLLERASWRIFSLLSCYSFFFLFSLLLFFSYVFLDVNARVTAAESVKNTGDVRDDHNISSTSGFPICGLDIECLMRPLLFDVGPGCCGTIYCSWINHRMAEYRRQAVTLRLPARLHEKVACLFPSIAVPPSKKTAFNNRVCSRSRVFRKRKTLQTYFDN